MLKINFYPDSDKKGLIEAVEGYKKIWLDEAEKIVESIKKVSGLSFVEKEINAVVFEGRSGSSPLCLRASYSYATKKASLVHELCHRLLDGNGLGLPRGQNSSLEHKHLDLVLYDIWIDLYGQLFANEQIAIESNKVQLYKEAWDYALAFTKEERKIEFKKLARTGASTYPKNDNF